MNVTSRRIGTMLKNLESKYGLITVIPHKFYTLIIIKNYDDITSMNTNTSGGTFPKTSQTVTKNNQKGYQEENGESAVVNNSFETFEKEVFPKTSQTVHDLVGETSTIIEYKDTESKESILHNDD
jgi:hypothetical protein